MQKELGDNITHQDIKDYLWKTLKNGQVVPGLVADFPPWFSLVNHSQLWPWCLAKVGSSLYRAPGVLQ